jgi:hypothetical protein
MAQFYCRTHQKIQKKFKVSFGPGVELGFIVWGDGFFFFFFNILLYLVLMVYSPCMAACFSGNEMK